MSSIRVTGSSSKLPSSWSANRRMLRLAAPRRWWRRHEQEARARVERGAADHVAGAGFADLVLLAVLEINTKHLVVRLQWLVVFVVFDSARGRGHDLGRADRANTVDGERRFRMLRRAPDVLDRERVAFEL